MMCYQQFVALFASHLFLCVCGYDMVYSTNMIGLSPNGGYPILCYIRFLMGFTDIMWQGDSPIPGSFKILQWHIQSGLTILGPKHGQIPGNIKVSSEALSFSILDAVISMGMRFFKGCVLILEITQPDSLDNNQPVQTICPQCIVVFFLYCFILFFD